MTFCLRWLIFLLNGKPNSSYLLKRRYNITADERTKPQNFWVHHLGGTKQEVKMTSEYLDHEWSQPSPSTLALAPAPLPSRTDAPWLTRGLYSDKATVCRKCKWKMHLTRLTCQTSWLRLAYRKRARNAYVSYSGAKSSRCHRPAPKRVLYYTLLAWGKDQNSDFEVQFLLNAYHFHTIIKSNYHKLGDCLYSIFS